MAVSGTRYNNGMSNVNSNPCNCEPMCTTCGRPWVVCKGECGCKKSCCNNVNFCEYGCAVPGCIRERAPECPMQAVIPSVVVEDLSGLKNLADCFVHVSSLNTTFYIDDKHRMTITWAGPVEYNNYDLAANTLGLRGQFLIDRANNRSVYYTKTGEYQIIGDGNGGDSALSLKLNIAAEEPWVFLESGLTLAGNIHISSRTVPISGFSTVEDPDVTYTIAEVFDMLEDGADIIFNGAPLGWLADATMGPIAGGGGLVAPEFNTDSLRMGSRVEGTKNIGSGRIADTITWSGITLSNRVPLGYGVKKTTYDGESTYIFFAQGIDDPGTPN